MVKSLTTRPLQALASNPLRGRRIGLATLLGVTALLGTACGSSNSTPASRTLNAAPVERAIEQSILKQRGVSTQVACPADAPLQTSYQFVCLAHLDVGSYPVTVIELNANGGVKYANSAPLRTLDPRKIVTAIEAAILRKKHLRSTVTCPATILQAKGLTFECAARTRLGLGQFSVTETDANGHVSFKAL